MVEGQRRDLHIFLSIFDYFHYNLSKYTKIMNREVNMQEIGVIATTFASRIGADARSRNSLIDHIPAMISDSEDMRIDVTSLIIYGELHMDVDSFDMITRNRYSKTRYLAGQLRDLWEAGFLKTYSLPEVVSGMDDFISKNTDYEIANNREFWLDEVKKSILWWEGVSETYRAAYGKRYQGEGLIAFGIKCVLDDRDLKLTKENADLVRTAIFDGKHPDHQEAVDIALTTFINYASTTRLQSDVVGSPCLHWQDLQEFVCAQDRVSAHRRKLVLSAADFLVTNLAGIDTRAVSNAGLIRLLSDPQIYDVRKLIYDAVREGKRSVLLDKTAVYSRLRSLDAEVRRKDGRRFATRLFKAALGGNSSIVDIASGIINPHGVIAKTIDDFLKSSILDAEPSANDAAADRTLRAMYILTKNIRASGTTNSAV